METSKWHVKSWCEEIRDNAEFIKDCKGCPDDVKDAVQSIRLAAFKIEAEVLDLKLHELVDA